MELEVNTLSTLINTTVLDTQMLVNTITSVIDEITGETLPEFLSTVSMIIVVCLYGMFIALAS